MPEQMTNPTQQPTPLEAVWKEIEDKADEYARNQSGYILDGDELGAENNPQKHNYDRIKRHCKALATSYGERLVAAEELIEKMAKALEKTKSHTIDKDTYHTYEAFFKDDLAEALSDYQTYLKTREDGE
jgi:hypothetical protein